MKTPLLRAIALAATAVAAASGLAGCSGDDSGAQAAAVGTAISAERCAKNKEAGKITFLTGYYYQASASILEFLAAKRLGYFDALCLDVDIKPGTGDTGQNTQLLASGQVTISPVSEQDVIQARDNGVDVLGISAYSNAGLEVLLTMPATTDLKQLDGTTLGHKGSLPIGVQAMLTNAGVDVGSLKQVVVGYDPSILPRGQVQSLTGFVSNEPNLLAASGREVKVWRPYDYDVPGSLAGMAANPAFAAKNPTAVQDFLRAGLHAYAHCSTNAEECVGYAAEESEGGYDKAHNVKIWQTEVALVKETGSAGSPLGAVDADNVTALAGLLSKYSMVKQATAADAKSYFDPSFIEAVYDSGRLVWPAP
ncbi:ABC transporter substrate-binding protein [Saccharothrix deserti]|uniref:ABC transporter substrate-binding protein n=1 Tax=Saccharothrix deserti TaxID=2593674 RepID=UPI00131ABB27|nr:ABC transporter substrate-binding protein [Saccharothrix deserti]